MNKHLEDMSWLACDTAYSHQHTNLPDHILHSIKIKYHQFYKYIKQFAYITITCLFKCIENFTTKKQKKGKFSDKNSDIFHIPAQNIDCRYSLELPRHGGSDEYP